MMCILFVENFNLLVTCNNTGFSVEFRLAGLSNLLLIQKLNNHVNIQNLLSSLFC